MNMKYIYRIGAAFVALLFTACEFQNEIYQDIPASSFPETEAQRNSIKQGAYGEQRHILDDWGYWLYAQETTSDVLVFPQRGTDWEDGGKWRVMNRHTWTSNATIVEEMWAKIYPIITRCNQSIELIENGTPGESADQAIAEMEVVRSFAYYLLIDNYGAVPYVNSFASADPAPYRNTRASICNELISVVEGALPKLPTRSEVTLDVATQSMARMLLAKLYLNKNVYTDESDFSAEDMSEVIALMDGVIAAGYTLESDRLAPFAVKNNNSTENIYTILSSKTSDDGMRIQFRTLHTLSQQTFNLESTPWNGCAVKPDFYANLFAANDGFDDADDDGSGNSEIVDQRASAFYRGQQYDAAGEPLKNDNGDLVFTNDIPADLLTENGSYTNAEVRFSGYRIAKFEVEKGAGPIMNNDFPVFRLADAYLMRAEAALRGGTGGDADADVNKIRNIAGLPSISGATEQDLLDERGRELFLEGHRRSDLIRFGKFAQRNWWLGADDSDPGEHRLLFQLPQSQIDVNPNLSADPVPIDNE